MHIFVTCVNALAPKLVSQIQNVPAKEPLRVVQFVETANQQRHFVSALLQLKAHRFTMPSNMKTLTDITVFNIKAKNGLNKGKSENSDRLY